MHFFFNSTIFKYINIFSEIEFCFSETDQKLNDYKNYIFNGTLRTVFTVIVALQSGKLSYFIIYRCLPLGQASNFREFRSEVSNFSEFHRLYYMVITPP